jgi:hypothetical protein
MFWGAMEPLSMKHKQHRHTVHIVAAGSKKLIPEG